MKSDNFVGRFLSSNDIITSCGVEIGRFYIGRFSPPKQNVKRYDM